MIVLLVLLGWFIGSWPLALVIGPALGRRFS